MEKIKTKMDEWRVRYKMKLPSCATRCALIALLALISITCCLPTNAQNSQEYLLKKNQLRLGIGVGYFKIADFQFAANEYQTSQNHLKLSYTHSSKKRIFATNLNVFIGSLTPTTGPKVNTAYIKETDIYGVENVTLNEIELSQMGFNLEIDYLQNLSMRDTGKNNFYLGGSLEECFSYTPGFLNIGTINYGALNVKARFDHSLKNSKSINFGISLPVVAVVTRFPYHNSPNFPGKSAIEGFFTDNNNIETLNHFQNFRFSTKYNWLVRKRLALDITYEASYMHYNRPEHLTEMGNQISLGINF